MRIASCENLELLLSGKRNKYYQISFLDSTIYNFTKTNLPKKNLIIAKIDKSKTNLKECYFNEDKMFAKTDVLNQFKKHKITGFVPGEPSTPYKEKIAKANGFEIISPKWQIRKKLENKIFFDKLLTDNKLPKPKSWIIKSKKDVSEIDRFPCVLQAPNSSGSQGTFFLKNREEIEKTITTKHLKFPLLCREYIDGIPFGISFLLSKKEIILSALRLQMFFPKKDGTNDYFGTQWIKKSDLPKTVIKEIETSMLKMGEVFRSFGFHGISGFDFMIKDKKIFFIECNPRLSGPTPQVSEHKELLHNLDFAEEFIAASTGKRLSLNKPFIPDTKFKGCTIDLDFMRPNLENITVKNSPKAGYYKFEKNKLEYISEKIKDYDEKNLILLRHYFIPRTRITKNSVLGFAYTNMTICEMHGNNYSITENGKNIFNTLKWTLGKQS